MVKHTQIIILVYFTILLGWRLKGHETQKEVFLSFSLKVHQCRYENLAIHSSSNKNSFTKIAHDNNFHFLRYAHLRYAKCLFTNIQKQYITLKSSILFKKNTNFTGG